MVTLHTAPGKEAGHFSRYCDGLQVRQARSSIPCIGRRSTSSAPRPDWLLGPHSLFDGYQGLFLGGESVISSSYLLSPSTELKNR
jgi:hypothetical protein